MSVVSRDRVIGSQEPVELILSRDCFGLLAQRFRPSTYADPTSAGDNFRVSCPAWFAPKLVPTLFRSRFPTPPPPRVSRALITLRDPCIGPRVDRSAIRRLC